MRRVFQEEGWPPRIDDPLPPHPDQVAKKRLHDTITTLNRHHQHRLIRFLGDGTGQGVRWKLLFPQVDRKVSSERFQHECGTDVWVNGDEIR